MDLHSLVVLIMVPLGGNIGDKVYCVPRRDETIEFLGLTIEVF